MTEHMRMDASLDAGQFRPSFEHQLGRAYRQPLATSVLKIGAPGSFAMRGISTFSARRARAHQSGRCDRRRLSRRDSNVARVSAAQVLPIERNRFCNSAARRVDYFEHCAVAQVERAVISYVRATRSRGGSAAIMAAISWAETVLGILGKARRRKTIPLLGFTTPNAASSQAKKPQRQSR